MGKLRLEPEDLRVESFSTETVDARRGTVRGLSGTAYTICWGLCGDAGASDCALSCGAASEGCTYDPRDANCISYAEPCPPTQPPNGTCDHTCVNHAGNTVCGVDCY